MEKNLKIDNKLNKLNFKMIGITKIMKQQLVQDCSLNNLQYASKLSINNLEVYSYKDISDDYKNINSAKNEVGVYIFFYEEYDKNHYLYVGECHKKTKNWSLYKRLCQHFRPSDTAGILNKIGRRSSRRAKDIKQCFINKDIQVAYFILNEGPKEIKFIESYLIAMLRPEYNF